MNCVGFLFEYELYISSDIERLNSKATILKNGLWKGCESQHCFWRVVYFKIEHREKDTKKF